MTKATELRMSCLDLAIRSTYHMETGSQIVDRARAYEAFALGQNQSQAEAVQCIRAEMASAKRSRRAK